MKKYFYVSDSLKPTNSLVGKKKLYQRLFIGVKRGLLTPKKITRTYSCYTQ